MSGWTVDTLKELLELRLDKSDMALSLQAREYERRLNDLNGAHQQAEERAATYLTIDKYETQRDSDLAARTGVYERLSARIDSLERWRSRAAGIGAVLVLLAAVFGGIVDRIIRLP